jgi:hypothetical protein
MMNSLALAFAIGAFVWLMVSIIVADHAVGNGKSQLWGVAVFFLGIFGLVGYAISLASD